MAIASIMRIISFAILLPAALALPFDFFEFDSYRYQHGPQHYGPSVSTSPTSSSNSILPTGSSFFPTGTSYPFPTATGTATSTGTSYLTYTMNADEARDLAQKKRRSFEGPRHNRGFPHYYPIHNFVYSVSGPPAGTASQIFPTATASGAIGTGYPYPSHSSSMVPSISGTGGLSAGPSSTESGSPYPSYYY